ncbi:MAG: hypothetical protein CL678_16085 [Bdellovibrionaceae bacterium]|nr:hypothetical protein [Pseudobdellovibrionaceae bacterium]
MIIAENIAIGSTISFSVYGEQVLGSGFKRAKVQALLDPETAMRYADVVAMHSQVLPFLPEGTPSSYSGYYYLKLKMPNQTTTIVGVPWIKLETVEVYSATSLQFDIHNVSPQDQDRIRRLLLANNYTQLESRTLDV